MVNMSIVSQEYNFRVGLKDAGYVSSDFRVKYEKMAPAAASNEANINASKATVRVLRISNAAARTYPGGGNSWAEAALAQLKAGDFGGK